MREEVRTHQRLATLAAKQHGVVSARQLQRLGYSTAAVGRAKQAGRLHRVHRGVYAVGHARLTAHGRCLAAVAACGRGALLSHASAAWLWGLLSPCPTEVDVTAATRRHRRNSIRVHFATLTDEDRSKSEAVPVTAVPRTLLDLAATGRHSRLDHAVQQAERLDLLDVAAIDALLQRRYGAPGTTPLRLALEIYRDPVFSRSRYERLLLDLVKRANLPRPAINTYVEGHEIDAFWERERFAVEVDGWDAHRSRAAFEQDPVRQEELKLAGIDSIRLTARRIEREPAQIAERLGILLARRREEFRQ
jgi:predicted transcriptional regulator of viral defense system/very-short-patch-repair endonuclease